MVRFMPMNEGEFQASRQAAITQIACDHVKAGTWTRRVLRCDWLSKPISTCYQSEDNVIVR